MLIVESLFVEDSDRQTCHEQPHQYGRDRHQWFSAVTLEYFFRLVNFIENP